MDNKPVKNLTAEELRLLDPSSILNPAKIKQSSLMQINNTVPTLKENNNGNHSNQLNNFNSYERPQLTHNNLSQLEETKKYKTVLDDDSRASSLIVDVKTFPKMPDLNSGIFKRSDDNERRDKDRHRQNREKIEDDSESSGDDESGSEESEETEESDSGSEETGSGSDNSSETGSSNRSHKNKPSKQYNDSDSESKRNKYRDTDSVSNVSSASKEYYIDMMGNRYRRGSPEYRNKQQQVILQFAKYEARKMNVPKFDYKHRLEDMELSLAKIKETIQIEKNIKFYRIVIIGFTQLFESVCKRSGYDMGLKGWAKKVRETINEYDEYIEDYSEENKINIPPLVGLGSALAMSAIKYSMANNIPKITKLLGDDSMELFNAGKSFISTGLGGAVPVSTQNSGTNNTTTVDDNLPGIMRGPIGMDFLDDEETEKPKKSKKIR